MTETILLNLDDYLKGSDVRSLAGNRWRKRETKLAILEMEEVMNNYSCVIPTPEVMTGEEIKPSCIPKEGKS